MTTRSVESHESTIKYFRTLGWTINYDEMITSVSEWLVETVQGDRSA